MSDVATIPASCWCERTTVRIPVQWVSEARTGSCGPGCGPGCPAPPTADSFDDLTEVAATGKKTKMMRFDANEYDPRKDSSYGYSQSSDSIRDAHPYDVILEVVPSGDGRRENVTLCACGCGESPAGKHAVFRMGHDARLRGKLARALAGGAQIVLTDDMHQIRALVDVEEYASRFSTDKLDWVQSIKDSASKAKRSAGDVEQEVMAKALGPQVGETKLIKVGRWEKTGRILAVYQDGAEVLYEYVDKAGTKRQARQSPDGKIHEVSLNEQAAAGAA